MLSVNIIFLYLEVEGVFVGDIISHILFKNKI